MHVLVVFDPTFIAMFYFNWFFLWLYGLWMQTFQLIPLCSLYGNACTISAAMLHVNTYIIKK